MEVGGMQKEKRLFNACLRKEVTCFTCFAFDAAYM